MQLSFMKPDQVLLGHFSSSQRSLGKEEELKLSVHLNSFKNHKSPEKCDAHDLKVGAGGLIVGLWGSKACPVPKE